MTKYLLTYDMFFSVFYEFAELGLWQDAKRNKKYEQTSTTDKENTIL